MTKFGINVDGDGVPVGLWLDGNTPVTFDGNVYIALTPSDLLALGRLLTEADLEAHVTDATTDFPEGTTALCFWCKEPILLDQREGGGPAKDWGTAPEDWVGNGGTGMDYGCGAHPLNSRSDGCHGHSPTLGTITLPNGAPA